MPGSQPLGNVTVPPKIHLRLKLFIRVLYIDKLEPLVISIKGSPDLEVQYRRPDTDELKEGEEWASPLSLGDSMCVISGQWSISDKNREALEKLARDGSGELVQQFVVFGPVAGRTGMPAWDSLPPSLQELLVSAERKLGQAAARTYRLLRWFLALTGQHNPFHVWSYSWSPDGSLWQDLPLKMPLGVAMSVPTLSPSRVLVEEIEKALEGGRDEPIAHELLREAIHQVEQNPRSALIVGIAAAEIGFKEFVSRRAPVAAWLVTEAPSPSLLQMLTEFLPDLLGQLQMKPLLQFVKGRDKKGYNDPVLRELQRGVTMRNQLAHKPKPAPDSEDVKPILDAVGDLLGMLDYYSGGTPFGRSFIRLSTRQVWSHADVKSD